MTDSASFDHEVDLLVVGSGAGAMTTAIVAHDQGASTLLLEKSEHYGGSSAMSGGGLWIPNNHHMAECGIDDSPEDAWDYLSEITEGLVEEDRLRAYIDNAPKLLRYLEDNTRVRYVPLPEYADYYPSAKGAKPGGRALDPASFNAKVLGDDYMKLRPQNAQMLVMNRVFMTIFEARTMLTQAPGWIRLAAKLGWRYASDFSWRLKSKRDRNLAMGNSLVGMLRASMLDREIPLWLETPARRLITDDGRVVGVEAERGGQTFRIKANKGVVLAAGGFEGNQAMREKYLPGPTRVEWSCANKHNTGDAIGMGLDVGAALDLMDDGWWGPVTVVPGEEHARMLVIEKSLPGGVIVNKKGRRFVNEASTYIGVVNAMYENHSDESPCIPAYLVFDARYRKAYPVGPMLPGAQQPDAFLNSALKHGYIHKAKTLDELAVKAGIDAEGLKATVADMNEYAKTGVDPVYHRGETGFDRYYGDENVKPNPCLAPITEAPFYCLETYPGELGTKGGIKVDAKSRALTESGDVIAGLYAIGNCSAAVTGRTYPGAGATLGPATTFGMIAALNAVET